MRTQQTFDDANWLGIAISVAMNAHGDQRDRGGLPYVDHPWAVAAFMREDGFSRGYQMVAFLHDVVEDTEETLQSLSDRGFHPTVVDAVDAISQREGEGLGEYLIRVRENPVATEVKRYDVWHNLSPSRLSQIPEGERQRLVRKYTATLNFLHDVAKTETRPMSASGK